MLNRTLKIAAMCALVIITSHPTWAEKASNGSNADYRNAKNGQYVKKDYAQRNKDTSVREERKKN